MVSIAIVSILFAAPGRAIHIQKHKANEASLQIPGVMQGRDEDGYVFGGWGALKGKGKGKRRPRGEDEDFNPLANPMGAIPNIFGKDDDNSHVEQPKAIPGDNEANDSSEYTGFYPAWPIGVPEYGPNDGGYGKRGRGKRKRKNIPMSRPKTDEDDEIAAAAQAAAESQTLTAPAPEAQTFVPEGQAAPAPEEQGNWLTNILGGLFGGGKKEIEVAKEIPAATVDQKAGQHSDFAMPPAPPPPEPAAAPPAPEPEPPKELEKEEPKKPDNKELPHWITPKNDEYATLPQPELQPPPQEAPPPQEVPQMNANPLGVPNVPNVVAEAWGGDQSNPTWVANTPPPHVPTKFEIAEEERKRAEHPFSYMPTPAKSEGLPTDANGVKQDPNDVMRKIMGDAANSWVKGQSRQSEKQKKEMQKRLGPMADILSGGFGGGFPGFGGGPGARAQTPPPPPAALAPPPPGENPYDLPSVDPLLAPKVGAAAQAIQDRANAGGTPFWR